MIPLPVILFFRKFWPYFAMVAVVIGVALLFSWWLSVQREEAREEGRNEIRAEWTAAKLTAAEATAELVAKARKEEQDKVAADLLSKEKTDAENEELSKRVAAFERDSKRLRIDPAKLCAGQPSLPRAPDGASLGTAPPGGEPQRAGAGEINLDDVAGEIGRLGADLEAANTRIKRLIFLAGTCVKTVGQ